MDCAEENGLILPPNDPSKSQTYDTVELTDGGAQMWQLYLLYRNTAGWWNDNSTGVLSFEDWFGLMIMYEIYNETVATGAYIEAVARQLYMVGNPGDQFPTYCPNNICINGALNFLYAYSSSIKGQVNYLSSGIPPANYPGYYSQVGGDTTLTMQRASIIGNSILYANTLMDFYRQRNLDRPFHFGNNSMWKNTSMITQFYQLNYGFNGFSVADITVYKWGWWDQRNPKNDSAGAILTVNQEKLFNP